MTPSGFWWTLSCEIAIFHQKRQHYRGSGASGAGSVVFYRLLWTPVGPGPETATLPRIPAPTPPDAERQGHLFLGAAPFACGSAVTSFKCRSSRHFCGSNFEISQHYRRSVAPARRFPLNSRRSCECLLKISQHCWRSGASAREFAPNSGRSCERPSGTGLG